jgi:hypothetical protein
MHKLKRLSSNSDLKASDSGYYQPIKRIEDSEYAKKLLLGDRRMLGTCVIAPSSPCTMIKDKRAAEVVREA